MTSRRDFLHQTGLTGMGVGLVALGSAPPSAWSGAHRDRQQKAVLGARFGRKTGATGKRGMAVTSHPLATRAAIDVLRRGGNACDAALCAAALQTVIEPHMTTITGMLSLLYHDAGQDETSYLNGTFNAPGTPLESFSAADVRTGRGAVVPGWWAGFEAALTRHGSKAPHELMAPAIAVARDGFEIHPFLYGMMFGQVARLGRHAEGREIYMPEGALLPSGATLRQPKAARTLERLAAEGSDYFYRGAFARRFCEVVRNAGGVVTPADFEAYEVRWQPPARGTYRGFDIVGSPPPDNGGSMIIEALNMIELLDLQRHGPPTESPETLHHVIRINNEVMDGGNRQHDPATHPLPLEIILSKEYARIRFELLQMGSPQTPDEPQSPGTTHVTVVDGQGNVASLLHSSAASPWANGLFVDGISVAAAGGHFLRSMPKPGYRIAAYIAPNMVFRGGRPVLASGSPSVSLIANILQNTVNILDFDMPIEESVHRPRFGAALEGKNLIEADFDERLRRHVEARGVRLDVVNPWSFSNGSFEGVRVDAESGTLTACADPRRTGLAEGL